MTPTSASTGTAFGAPITTPPFQQFSTISEAASVVA